MVVGLYGPWGDGKTSVLNLVEHALAGADGMVPVGFNPWRLGSETEMFVGFFETLAEALDAELTTGVQKVGELLKRYGGLLKPIPFTGGAVGEAAVAAGGALSETSLAKARARIRSATWALIVRTSCRQTICGTVTTTGMWFAGVVTGPALSEALSASCPAAVWSRLCWTLVRRGSEDSCTRQDADKHATSTGWSRWSGALPRVCRGVPPQWEGMPGAAGRYQLGLDEAAALVGRDGREPQTTA